MRLVLGITDFEFPGAASGLPLRISHSHFQVGPDLFLAGSRVLVRNTSPSVIPDNPLSGPTCTQRR